jgi:DNA-binding NarL/FixJ family response regulator
VAVATFSLNLNENPAAWEKRNMKDQKSGDKGRTSGVEGQRSEVRGRESKVGSPKSAHDSARGTLLEPETAENALSAEKSAVRILMIDDHPMFRSGLRILIENQPGMKVVGEAGTRIEALALTASQQPDLILLDLDLGVDSGVDFIPELLATAQQARVLVLTGVLDPDAHRRAVSAGALGVVLKEKAVDVLIKAIERVHAGEVWLERWMTASVLSELSRAKEAKNAGPEAIKIAELTEREREIIPLVGLGLKNKQIAERLFISEATVRNHLTSILSKLELSDRFELALFAYRHKLAKLPQ